MNFFSRHKKVFLIIGFLVIIFILAYFIWRLFFQSVITVTPETPLQENNGNLPSAGLGDGLNATNSNPSNLPSSGGITKAGSTNTPNILAVGGLTKTESVTTSKTLGSTTSSKGGIQYYNQDDGRFYRIGKNGEITKLSDKVFYDVDSVTWSPDKNKAVIEYPDGNKIYYDFENKKQVTLPSYWEEFSFSPDSTQITAKNLGLDKENHWLSISSADGSNVKNLENIGANEATVYPSWSPNKQIVAMYTKGVDFDRQNVYFVGLNGENFKSTLVEGRGFEAQWSTSGEKLLYSVYSTSNDLNPKLWIVDSAGDTIGANRTSLSLNTWASKCTFASDSEIYCAVPETLTKGSGLFPELADNTKDNLYKINLKTGAQELIAVPDGAYNISQVMVPENDNYLYFTDKKTNQIYKVRLR